MQIRYIFFTVVLGFCLNLQAESLKIAPEDLDDISQQRHLLVQSMNRLDDIGKKIQVAKSEKRHAMASVKRLDKEVDEARLNLEKMQRFDREVPGSITPNVMREAQDKNRNVSRELEDAKIKVSTNDIEINSLSSSANEAYADYLLRQKSYVRDIERIVESQLQKRLSTLQVKKEVQVTSKVACANDSIPVCKERSKKAAEMDASERGSVVFVDSLTEVKNFQLSKEEVRSEVQATLTNKVFSNQHFVGDAEYETTITATVEPAIGTRLREQMANTIRSQVNAKVGGKIDFSLVKNPSVFASSQDESSEVPYVPVSRDQSRRELRENVVEEPQQAPPPRQEAPAPQQAAPTPSTPSKQIRPIFTF